VALAVGEPFDVPSTVDVGGIEEARVYLEARLRALELRAAEMIGT
jgi:hypothetical protein